MATPLEQETKRGDRRVKPVELDLTEAEIRDGLDDLVKFNQAYDRLVVSKASGAASTDSRP